MSTNNIIYGFIYYREISKICSFNFVHCISVLDTLNNRGRTGLVVRASDSGSGDPGSILGGVGVLFP